MKGQRLRNTESKKQVQRRGGCGEERGGKRERERRGETKKGRSTWRQRKWGNWGLGKAHGKGVAKRKHKKDDGKMDSQRAGPPSGCIT